MHYWIKITSQKDHSRAVFIDDGFMNPLLDWTYVHDEEPVGGYAYQPPGHLENPYIEYRPFNPPPVYDSDNNIHLWHQNNF